MTKGYANFVWFVLVTQFNVSYFYLAALGHGTRTATACYGNVNNYLRLDCEHGARIAVFKVIHGVKPKTSNCTSPASLESYRKSCCQPRPGDCTIDVPHVAISRCNDQSSCEAIATWSNTNQACDQDVYPPATNYMLMAYTCVGGQTISPSARPTDADVTTSGDEYETSSATPTTSTKKRVTLKLSEGHVSSDDELSDSLIGAIVGGSLGMVLTLIVFVFYWGRKRRLRIVTKPQPTVWDFLLPQTFTVRGARGYDHFTSVRSSASSDGDPGSPVQHPRNIWLPNIAPQEVDVTDEASSIYDNDSERIHRVEVHPNASPSPYAILNLEVNPEANINNDNSHHDV